MPGPLRVTFAVDSTVWGGAEASVASLLRELPERVSTTVLTLGEPPARLAAAASARGSLVTVAPVGGKADLAGLRALDRALRGTRPDVVHLNQSIPTNNRHLLGAALARRVPVVPVLHLWGALLSPPQTRLLGLAYRRTAQVVTVSGALAQRLRSDLGVRHALVVRNGVTLLPAAPGSGSARVRIGTVGRLVEQKGHATLVEAVRRLHAEGLPLEVAVAGGGPLADHLRVASEGLPVQWLGEVGDVAGFLAGLDGFVLPSLDEGLPLALLEAMGAGLPCVASDVGDIGEALPPAEGLVPPGDPAALAGALRALVLDPGLRATRGGASRARVAERFTAAAHARAMLDVYDRVARR